VLSVIGLACDLVGATVLARGLFRPASRYFPAFGRSPKLAAEDWAYGIVGALLLAAGFTGQALPALGVIWRGTTSERRDAAAVALGVAVLAAVYGYGLAWTWAFRREVRRANKGYGALSYRWRPTLLRPWNHDLYDHGELRP
jgi:hypothetical protein